MSNMVEEITANAAALPLEKQRAALDYIKSLAAQRQAQTASQAPLSLLGLWSDLGVDITDEDIREARREMWENFPREDIL